MRAFGVGQRLQQRSHEHLFRLRINIHKPPFTVIFNTKYAHACIRDLSGKQEVSDSTWRQQRSEVECIAFINFVVYFLESFGDTLTHGPLTIYCFTDLSHLQLRNVHAIMLHVSEVPCSGAVSAHTLNAYHARAWSTSSNRVRAG